MAASAAAWSGNRCTSTASPSRASRCSTAAPAAPGATTPTGSSRGASRAAGHANAASATPTSSGTSTTTPQSARAPRGREPLDGADMGTSLKRTTIRFSVSRMLGDPILVKSECSFYIRLMPRVSQAHLDARRRQILDAARRCFVRNGFHATSMQDVLGEANLSSGAVYRYFGSKDEIIAAIAAEAVAEVAGALDSAFDADDPPPLDEVLGAAFLAIRRVDADQGMARLALQVWSEAVRSPVLAAILKG